MARPRKSDAEKLVPAKTSIRTARFDALDREARERGIPLARVIRERLDPEFGFCERKTSLGPLS